jgi:hypothetical protein
MARTFAKFAELRQRTLLTGGWLLAGGWALAENWALAEDRWL